MRRSGGSKKTPEQKVKDLPKDQRLNEGFGRLKQREQSVARREKAAAKNEKALADSKKKAKEDAAEATKQAKDKNSMSYASLAALGIGTAAAVAIIAKALAEYIASDGAVIRFTDISPQTTTASFVPSFFGQLFTPSKFEMTWEVKTVPPGGLKENVKVIKGNTVRVTGTGIKSIDGKTLTVLDVLSDNVFVVDSKMQDSSNEKSSTGEGVISTEYDDNLNDNIQTATGLATGGIGAALEGATGGLMKHIGTIIFVIVAGIGLFFLFNLLTSIAQKK
jgi:hypothetical protein